MKLLWSMIVSIAVLGVAASVILKRLNPEQETRSGPSRSWLKGLSGEDDNSNQTVNPVVSGSMYRWRDANGTLHIESAPPALGVSFETIDYVSEIKPTKQPATDELTATENPSTQLLVRPASVYTSEGISELMDRVEDTAKKLNTRDQLLNEPEGEL